MEPYLMNNYHQKISQDHSKSKCFQILGMDILIDKKNNAWLMEVNSNPSLNMFLEKETDLHPG
jgi:tubulin polyglutamylase TTLL6/13